MANFTAPLVGMHFRPPAKDIVNCLPAGVELLLEHQPDNPYDGDAIRVLLFGFTVGGQHEELFRQFDTPDNEGRLTDPFMLGFIANSEKTGGKFASKLLEALTIMETASITGKLTFTERAAPAVLIDVPDEVAAKLGEKAAEESLEKTQDIVKKNADIAQRQPSNQTTDDEIPF